MTETTVEPTSEAPSEARLSIQDAAASLAERRDGIERPRRTKPEIDAYESGDAGVRQAAESLRHRREQERERQAIIPEFAGEIERALPEARARQQARADEIEFAQGYERGAKLREKATWTVKEATDVHVGKRELARELAEADLRDAILANR